MVRNPFRRAARVPAEVLRNAPLARGERVLAAAAARDGSWLLGTRDALLLVPPGGTGDAGPGGPGVVVVPWERVERADWDRESDRLRVLEVGEFGRVRPEHEFLVDQPGTLVQLVRERVTASVVLQRRVVVSGKRGLYVVARRPPRGAGEVTWAYEFDQGVDPGDPEVMRAAEEGLRAAAEEVGL